MKKYIPKLREEAFNIIFTRPENWKIGICEFCLNEKVVELIKLSTNSTLATNICKNCFIGK